MQDKSTPVMFMEQQVIDVQEKRVNYLQLKYYLYITMGLPLLGTSVLFETTVCGCVRISCKQRSSTQQEPLF